MKKHIQSRNSFLVFPLLLIFEIGFSSGVHSGEMADDHNGHTKIFSSQFGSVLNTSFSAS